MTSDVDPPDARVDSYSSLESWSMHRTRETGDRLETRVSVAGEKQTTDKEQRDQRL